MPAPIAARVELTEEERTELEALTRRHTAGQQLVGRARIILAAADGHPNGHIAQALGVSRETVRRWRQRWLSLAAVPLAEVGVTERLADAPRPGRPTRVTAEQRCRLVALACTAPSTQGRPISQWTGREIAAALVAEGIVDAISPRHAARLVKRGTASPTASGTG